MESLRSEDYPVLITADRYFSVSDCNKFTVSEIEENYLIKRVLPLNSTGLKMFYTV